MCYPRRERRVKHIFEPGGRIPKRGKMGTLTGAGGVDCSARMRKIARQPQKRLGTNSAAVGHWRHQKAPRTIDASSGES